MFDGCWYYCSVYCNVIMCNVRRRWLLLMLLLELGLGSFVENIGACHVLPTNSFEKANL